MAVFSIRCRCGRVYRHDNPGIHENYRCIPRIKCDHCHITTDSVDMPAHIAAEHPSKDRDLSVLNKNKDPLSIKQNRKCSRCGEILTVYAGSVCQHCGDK